jgi:hypothetical protein
VYKGESGYADGFCTDGAGKPGSAAGHQGKIERRQRTRLSAGSWRTDRNAQEGFARDKGMGSLSADVCQPVDNGEKRLQCATGGQVNHADRECGEKIYYKTEAVRLDIILKVNNDGHEKISHLCNRTGTADETWILRLYVAG